MARTTQAFEDKIKRAIRDAFAYDPLLTQSALIEHLNKRFSHSFDPRYIKRLTNKVMGQERAELDRATINPRLGQLRETYRIARERLLQVLCWTPNPDQPLEKGPGYMAIVEAAKNLVMLDIAVLNAEVANGLYKDLNAAAADLKYPALPDEQRGQIVSTFQKWNILPPGSLVEHVTIHATRAITAAE
jgi:hypothetical protein